MRKRIRDKFITVSSVLRAGALCALLPVMLFTGCGSSAQEQAAGSGTKLWEASSISESEIAQAGLSGSGEGGSVSSGSAATEVTEAIEAPAASADWADRVRTGSMELAYAKQFSVDEYGDWKLITIGEDEQELLLVPEGVAVPAGVPAGVVVLQQPLDHTYLVSSSVMDYMVTIDALPDVTLSGIKESDWYIPEAVQAMQEGAIRYAGKYNAPDYELILSDGCNFAIENTMIYHNPDVKEKLESLGIPVMVERSSYEDSPFGRLEWIRLYGVLYDRQEKADSWFASEMESLRSLLGEENTGKTAAYFSITTNGSVTIRKPGDYVSRMIELAGGTYIFTDLPEGEDASRLSTMNIQFEDFYRTARDADVLIYNSSIEAELSDLDDLVAKNALFRDFKAVQNGNVWCTGKSMFQQPTGTGAFIRDLHSIFTGDGVQLTYLKKLE